MIPFYHSTVSNLQNEAFKINPVLRGLGKFMQQRDTSHLGIIFITYVFIEKLEISRTRQFSEKAVNSML